jgi:crossover junction endodeoxyribonuclease RuvC
MKIVAIDPGLVGSGVVLEDVGGTIVLVSLIDLPTAGEAAKCRLDAVTFTRWLRDHSPSHGFVEAAQGMPRQGVASVFRYARCAGAIEGVIAANGIPLTLVQPVVWKRYFKLSASKEDARARAIQLLPSAAAELQKIKHHHRAEAILLGVYGLAKGVAA